jgi:hypothetical protein
VLNLASNKLGEIVLPEGWSYSNYYEKYQHTDGREQKENPGKPEGTIAIAKAIPDMGVLSVLSMKDNRLATKEGGKALAQALANNSTLKELDVSSNNWKGWHGNWQGDGPGFAQELAVGIADNEALSFLNVKDNKIGDEGKRSLGKAIQESNVQFLVCDERSVTQDTTELDVSGKDLQAAGAALLGGVISNNGALTSLDISSNNLVGEKGTGRYKTVGAEFSDESDEEEEIMEPDFSGIIAIANAIPDMRALTTLNLSSNSLEAEGAKIIAEALPVTNYVIAVILAPFPCRSDHWLNYCCLLLSIGYGDNDEPQSC